MRRTLATLLIAVIGMGAPLTATPAAAAGPSQESPETLYDEGKTAYDLGDYKTAVEKMKRAYDLAQKMEDPVVTALLLYNISLAYKGLYSITKDIADLRRALAVLNNFIRIANSSPDVDIDDAEARREELEQMIREAEEAEAANRPPPPQPNPEDGALKTVDLGKDPGRKLRIAGIATMAGGGAIAITGVGLSVFYAIKGREFGEGLRIDNAAYQAAECDEMGMLDPESTCGELEARIEYYRESGRRANNLSVVFGAVLGGIGAVALIAGGLVFNEGNKRTKQWEKATRTSKVRLLPAPRGIVLTGRF